MEGSVCSLTEETTVPEWRESRLSDRGGENNFRVENTMFLIPKSEFRNLEFSSLLYLVNL